MADLTRVFSAIVGGDPQAAAHMLPLVYQELRQLAAAKMANERPDHSLDATAQVHEAHLRLVGGENRSRWDHRRQVFAAVAEAVRRVLVDQSRTARAGQRDAPAAASRWPALPIPRPVSPVDWLIVDDASARLAQEDSIAAELVRLKLFAGLSTEEVAELLGTSRATADRDWAFARARLREASGIGSKNSPIS